MSKPMFRDLRADEIEVRVALVKPKGVSLLLYKDARVDQNILDETVGAMNWQRYHSRDNANCIVEIWDEEKKQWISKEDTGVESFTEKEKGLASDSFKRACFNWGIGRELYTAPFIWVKAEDLEKHEMKDGKWKCGDSFVVDSIAIKDKQIVEIAIKNLNTKQIVFSSPNGKQAKQEPPKQETPKQEPPKQEPPKQEAPKQETTQQPLTPREMLIARLNELDIPIKKYAKEHGITAGVPDEVFLNCLKELENR